MWENLLASWRQFGQKQDHCPSLLNHNAKYKRLLPPCCDFANGVSSLSDRRGGVELVPFMFWAASAEAAKRTDEQPARQEPWTPRRPNRPSVGGAGRRLTEQCALALRGPGLCAPRVRHKRAPSGTAG